MKPDWTHLPQELFTVIGRKLTNPLDFIHFRSVCTRWRSAVKPTDLPIQTPWLLIPANSAFLSFFCPLTGKTLRLNLPGALGMSICGSSYGWLIHIHPISSAISLLNPLTGSHILLPPISILPGLISILENGSVRVIHDEMSIRSASLSSDPSSSTDGGCIIMATFQCSQSFIFCRLGDEKWTKINTGLGMSIAALSYYDGMFYAMSSDGRCAICSTTRNHKVDYILPAVMGIMKPYLVESDGDLLLVANIQHDITKVILMFDQEGRRNYISSDEWFEVLRLDVSGQRPTWSKIESIGENVLFLSANGQSSIRASEVSDWCRRNSIYFARAPNVSANDVAITAELDGIGVLDLENGSVEILPGYLPFVRGELLEGIWYTPSIL